MARTRPPRRWPRSAEPSLKRRPTPSPPRFFVQRRGQSPRKLSRSLRIDKTIRIGIRRMMPVEEIFTLRTNVRTTFTQFAASELAYSCNVPIAISDEHNTSDVERYAFELFLYESNYELICEYHLSNEKIFLGRREFPKICRFCRRSQADTNFQKRAHVIPASFGNTKLFSNYECDECNESFGKSFENDFATYFQPYRTLARIRGRGGLQSMKSDKNKWRIDAHDGGWHVSHSSDDPLVDHDPDAKTFTFKIRRGPYVPYEVYKCFLRIAITAMPQNEMDFFNDYLNWIAKTPSIDLTIEPAVIWETFINGPSVFRAPAVMLFRRRTAERLIPYMFCVICLANTMHQFWIPSGIKDVSHENEPMKFLLMPAHPRVTEFGARLDKLDFSNKSRVYDDVAEFPFTYDSYSKISDNK